MSRSRGRSCVEASNTGRANGNIVVPEGVDISAVRLPAEVDCADCRLDGRVRPLSGVGIGDTRLDCEAINSLTVQPSLNGAVCAQVILEALPGIGGEGSGGRNALRGEVRKSGIIRFVVVHQNFALATNAEVLAGGLGSVGHGDERNMGVR